jgi:VWFA-related protein
MVYNAAKRRYNLRFLVAFFLATISAAHGLGDGFSCLRSQEVKTNGMRNPGIVTLPVVVSDNAGRMMTDLAETDFLILEDKVPQKIEFMISPQMPHSILLALDTSSSMKPFFAEIQNRAVEFVNSLHSEDQTSVLAFSYKNMRLADFTTDRTRTINAIRTARLGGYTDLYQGIFYICEKVLMLHRKERWF